MKTLTPMKAIRAKCVECSGGVLKEVRECRVQSCPIWPYRMGTRPKTMTQRDRSKKGDS